MTIDDLYYTVIKEADLDDDCTTKLSTATVARFFNIFR